MNHCFGIRREDKNRWERRTPLVPEHVKSLIQDNKLRCTVQPSPIRIFNEDEYRASGAQIDENLSQCSVVFAVKEIPINVFQKGKTYVFFSHTIKGQHYNMPMLKKMLELECTLIEYERIVDSQGRRLLFFGRYAGLAGMIDTLWALGNRLKWEKLDGPFCKIQQAYNYQSLEDAKMEISKVGDRIKEQGIPEALCPFVCGFSGYGHVSQGAQEIFDLLPVEEIRPQELNAFIEKGSYSNKTLYKVVFTEEDMVEPLTHYMNFELQDYYEFPEKYRSKFDEYIPNLTVLVNAIYWDERYPRLVTKQYLKKLFENEATLRLRVIGDITCDIEGSIECTVRATAPDDPVFVYNPATGEARNGVEGFGVVVLGVDNLPCELPRDSSEYFSALLKEYVPEIVTADYSGSLEACQLSPEIKRAVVAYRGELTENYKYIQKYL